MKTSKKMHGKIERKRKKWKTNIEKRKKYFSIYNVQNNYRFDDKNCFFSTISVSEIRAEQWSEERNGNAPEMRPSQIYSFRKVERSRSISLERTSYCLHPIGQRSPPFQQSSRRPSTGCSQCLLLAIRPEMQCAKFTQTVAGTKTHIPAPHQPIPDPYMETVSF